MVIDTSLSLSFTAVQILLDILWGKNEMTTKRKSWTRNMRWISRGSFDSPIRFCTSKTRVFLPFQRRLKCKVQWSHAAYLKSERNMSERDCVRKLPFTARTKIRYNLNLIKHQLLLQNTICRNEMVHLAFIWY